MLLQAEAKISADGVYVRWTLLKVSFLPLASLATASCQFSHVGLLQCVHSKQHHQHSDNSFPRVLATYTLCTSPDESLHSGASLLLQLSRVLNLVIRLIHTTNQFMTCCYCAANPVSRIWRLTQTDIIFTSSIITHCTCFCWFWPSWQKSRSKKRDDPISEVLA